MYFIFSRFDKFDNLLQNVFPWFFISLSLILVYFTEVSGTFRVILLGGNYISA